MKRGDKFLILIIGIIFLTGFVSATLGISPAKIELGYNPGEKHTFTFSVFSEDPKQEIEIYSAGDLNETVSFDKKELKGGGSFTATIILPAKIEKPGNHRLLIGVREKIDKELASFIGTAVAVQAPIDIYVPYPGRYAEVSLSGENANIGEPIEFKLKITNRGKEPLNITPEIEIYSEDKQKLESLVFQNRFLESQSSIDLVKQLDTSNYNAGVYYARGVVDEFSTEDVEFKIGTLSLKLTNFTNRVEIGGVKAFDVEVESGWNNPLEDVYAEVSFSKDSVDILKFKTSPNSVAPWQRTIVSGFFDTSNFEQGIYDSNITIIYRGKNSENLVQVEFYKKKLNYMLIAVILISVIFVLIGVYFIIKKFKNKNGKKKR